MYTFPGNVMADGGAENKQSTERTSTERPAQLMDEMDVKEVPKQLGEAVQLREVDSTSIEESDWVRVKRSMAKRPRDCCP